MKYQNIIRCRFSAEPVLPQHLHQDLEIVYVLEGTLDMQFEAESFRLGTDDFLLVNSGVRHGWQAGADVLVGSIYIDSIMLAEIFGGNPPRFLCNSVTEKSDSCERMRYYIRQIFNYYQTTAGQGIVLKNAVYYQLLYLITTEFIVKKEMPEYGALRGIHDERLNEIMEYLTANYNQDVTLAGLAERLYLSVPYVSKYIKKNLGMSFLKLLNNIRLEKAVSELVYTGKTVLKIGTDCGFPSLTSFNRAFRETYHMTPTDYRTQMKSKLPPKKEPENSPQILERVGQYLSNNQIAAPEADDPGFSFLEVEKERFVPIRRSWCRMINAGPAVNLLRYDVREQIRYLKEKLGFEYVRIWNLLSKEMFIDLTGPRVSANFALVDQVLDFLTSAGLKPHIELNFKSAWHFLKVERGMLEKKFESQILLLEKNMAFFGDFVRHLARRYGPDTVGTWYFELEKNSVMQYEVSISHYFRVFAMIAQVLRTYAPGVKVGGAGFTVNMMGCQFREILTEWKNQKVQPDFLSIYSYPYLLDEELLDAGRNPYAPDEYYLRHQIEAARKAMGESGFADRELIVSEWSLTLSNRNILNDSSYKGAYIVKNIIENWDRADSLGYWLATDIFSENTDTGKLLFGGCGLLNQNGIPKPAYFGFETMGMTESRVLGQNANAIVTHNGKQLYFICCHNYKHFNYRFYFREESEIEIDSQQRLFEDNESLRMKVRIRGANNGRYVIKTYAVGPECGNIQSEWKRLGYFDDFSDREIHLLQDVCQPRLSIAYQQVEDHILELEWKIPAMEIQALVVSEM